jgi:hypothetical protein
MPRSDRCRRSDKLPWCSPSPEMPKAASHLPCPTGCSNSCRSSLTWRIPELISHRFIPDPFPRPEIRRLSALRGPKLTRPPHSQRFAACTQWNQVDIHVRPIPVGSKTGIECNPLLQIRVAGALTVHRGFQGLYLNSGVAGRRKTGKAKCGSLGIFNPLSNPHSDHSISIEIPGDGC